MGSLRLAKTAERIDVLFEMEALGDAKTEIPTIPRGKGMRIRRGLRQITLATCCVQESPRSSPSVGRVQHITQYDMAVVHSGFFAAILLHPRHFGIACTSVELDDYAFFWRVLGYLFGLHDRYNICSHGLDFALASCKEIECKVIWKGLQSPPDGWKDMAGAYVSGVNLFLAGGAALNSRESLVAFRVRMMGRVFPDWLRLTWLDRVRVWMLRLAAVMMLWCPGFEKVMNLFAYVLYRYSLRIISRQLAAYDGRDFRS